MLVQHALFTKPIATQVRYTSASACLHRDYTRPSQPRPVLLRCSPTESPRPVSLRVLSVLSSVPLQAFNLFSLAHKTGTIPKPQASAAVSTLRSKAEVMEGSLQDGVNLKLYRDVASKMAQISGLI